MSSTKDLTVCIIARDEEKNIGDCLESVQNCADEIIVVDTGSTDNTVNIASQYKCRIINFPWTNDFSAARNIGLSLVETEFVLVIDADERLINPEELANVTENANKETGAWLVHVHSPITANVSSSNMLLRLFRYKPGIKFSGIIHEQVLPSIIKAGYKLEQSRVILNHIGYMASQDALKQKHLRNLSLLDKALDEKTDNSYYLYQRAKIHFGLKNFDEAENDIRKAIASCKPNTLASAQYNNLGAAIAKDRPDIQVAKERITQSLKILPGQSFANKILGDIYLESRQFEQALEAYNKIELTKPETVYASMISESAPPSPDIVDILKAKCLFALKRYDEAYKLFKNVNSRNPQNISSLIGIANYYFKKKDFSQSLEFLKKADILSPDNPEIRKFIAQIQKYTPDSGTEPLSTQNNRERPLLSLSMIVKNEENDLPGCLKSARGIVDEIVIVDTGSDDSTVEIAKQHGAKVYHFDWIDDFAAARNESLKKCTGEWILYMDADERLNDDNKNQIRQLLEQAPDKIGAYIVTLESEHSKLDGNTEMHRGGYPRIFRNYGYPTIYFKGRVHEQITPSIFALNKSIDFSEITITHLGYNQPREVMEAKIKRNYKMLIQHVNEDPLNGYAWYQLGQTLAQMRLTDEAEKAIRFAVESGSLSSSVLASASATLSQLTGNQKKFEEALYWAEKSLKIAPDQAYAMNLKAYSLLYLEKFEEAEKCFLIVLDKLKNRKGVPKTGFDVVIPQDLVLHGLNEARAGLKK